MNQETVHLIIKGKVQGVFYRAGARDMAEKLGIGGWVRNTPDGNVEAMVTGNNEGLNSFIGWCKKGPVKAEVQEVKITPTDHVLFREFKILR